MSHLKKAREILKLSTREAAELAGISHETIAIAERENRVSLKTAEKLSEAYREAGRSQVAQIAKFVL